VPELVEVNNSLGRKVSFVASGRGGFSNGLSGADARSVFVTGDPAAAGTIVHTEPNGAVTKFNVAIAGEKYLLKQMRSASSRQPSAMPGSPMLQVPAVGGGDDAIDEQFRIHLPHQPGTIEIRGLMCSRAALPRPARAPLRRDRHR